MTKTIEPYIPEHDYRDDADDTGLSGKSVVVTSRQDPVLFSNVNKEALINQLPNEILSMIMMFSLRDDGNMWPDTRCNSTPLSLTSVCKQFYNISMTTPRLWAKVMLRDRGVAPNRYFDVEADTAALKAFVARSSPLPMSVDFHYHRIDIEKEMPIEEVDDGEQAPAATDADTLFDVIFAIRQRLATLTLAMPYSPPYPSDAAVAAFQNFATIRFDTLQYVQLMSELDAEIAQALLSDTLPALQVAKLGSHSTKPTDAFTLPILMASAPPSHRRSLNFLQIHHREDMTLSRLYAFIADLFYNKTYTFEQLYVDIKGNLQRLSLMELEFLRSGRLGSRLPEVSWLFTLLITDFTLDQAFPTFLFRAMAFKQLRYLSVNTWTPLPDIPTPPLLSMFTDCRPPLTYLELFGTQISTNEFVSCLAIVSKTLKNLKADGCLFTPEVIAALTLRDDEAGDTLENLKMSATRLVAMPPSNLCPMLLWIHFNGCTPSSSDQIGNMITSRSSIAQTKAATSLKLRRIQVLRDCQTKAKVESHDRVRQLISSGEVSFESVERPGVGRVPCECKAWKVKAVPDYNY